jgi:hypothetical protein
MRCAGIAPGSVDRSRSAASSRRSSLPALIGVNLGTVVGRWRGACAWTDRASSCGSHRTCRGAGTPQRVEQITTNLLSNALKYGAGKPITVIVGVFRDANGDEVPQRRAVSLQDPHRAETRLRDLAGQQHELPQQLSDRDEAFTGCPSEHCLFELRQPRCGAKLGIIRQRVDLDDTVGSHRETPEPERKLASSLASSQMPPTSNNSARKTRRRGCSSRKTGSEDDDSSSNRASSEATLLGFMPRSATAAGDAARTAPFGRTSSAGHGTAAGSPGSMNAT